MIIDDNREYLLDVEIMLLEKEEPNHFLFKSLNSKSVWNVPDLEELIKYSREDILDAFSILRSNEENLELCNILYLLKEGEFVDELTTQVPRLMNMLHRLPLANNMFGCIFFSKLGTTTNTKSHRGPTNCNVRMQIPIILPSDTHTYLMVDNILYPYELFKPIIFDTSFIHASSFFCINSDNNNIEHDNAMLLTIDIWHPDIRSNHAIQTKLNTYINKMLSKVPNWKQDLLLSKPMTPLLTPCLPPITPSVEPAIHQGDDLSISRRRVQYDHTLKFLLLGSYGVGKTAFLSRLAGEETFEEEYSPSHGIDFKLLTRICTLKEAEDQQQMTKIIRCQMWDSKRFRTITSSYYRGAHAFFLMFDLFDRSSFQDLPHWLAEIDRWVVRSYREVELCHVSNHNKKEYPTKIVPAVLLMGMKADLLSSQTREISIEEIITFAKERNLLYIECSSNEKVNVEESLDLAFSLLSFDLIKNALPIPNPYQLPPRPRGECLFM